MLPKATALTGFLNWAQPQHDNPMRQVTRIRAKQQLRQDNLRHQRTQNWKQQPKGEGQEQATIISSNKWTLAEYTVSDIMLWPGQSVAPISGEITRRRCPKDAAVCTILIISCIKPASRRPSHSVLYANHLGR